MSQPPTIPPAKCSTCGSHVHYFQVKANTNGNQGRWLAKCVQRNPETGETCNFFRWLPGSRTPSLSPRLGSTNASLQPTAPASGSFFPVPDVGGAQVHPLPAVAHKPSCTTMGCNSKRIRKGCGRRLCKAHCLEAGGCSDPAHKGSDTSVMSYMAPAPLATTHQPSRAPPTAVDLDTFSNSSIDPRLRQSDVQMTTTPLSSSLSVPMRTLNEPAFTSHIYTTHRALAETMRETGRQMEATRLESKRKVHQTVFVYAWMEDGVAPAPFEIQEGFVWPNFILNEAVLVSAGFTNISAGTSFNIFRFNLGHWTTVKTNHVVEVKETACVFVKAIHVQRCKDFEKFLTSTSSAIAPNIRTNLAGERAYVKKKMVEYKISQASQSSAIKNKHRLSTESLPSTPKKHRFMLDEVPTPTVTRYRAPIPPPKFTGKRAAGATQIVKKKVSAAQRERELWECYDSDSGIELTEFSPFSNPPPAPCTVTHFPTSRAPDLVASTSAASTVTLTSKPIVKQEALESTFSLDPFLISQSQNAIFGTLQWPADFYAVNIVSCFNETEDYTGDAQARSIFNSHFGQGVPYKKSTFYEHRARWQGASLEAKHTALSAGRTNAGRWANFMLTTPAPRALLKAARKRTAKQVPSTISPDIIEISSDEGSEM